MTMLGKPGKDVLMPVDQRMSIDGSLGGGICYIRLFLV
jgi:hypothetical protein